MGAPPNILLITIDTLRADHLSTYGYPRETSPHLTRLADEGVRFERAAVQWPKTGPSFASMMTATYPKDNGIVRKVGTPVPGSYRVGIPVPETMELLAEKLSELGYATYAVVANGAVSSEFGFNQGFQHYVESWRAPEVPGLDSTQAGRVTDLAIDLMREQHVDGGSPEPYFLWIHYLDPHFPYEPPGEYRDRFQDDEYFDDEVRIKLHRDKETQQMVGIGRKQILDNRDELAFYVARYDAEIAYTDAEIGRLLASFGELGLRDRTLTVVSSDHGESLGDHHYYFDHGRFIYQTCVQVPLIVHFPEHLPPRVDPEPVELIHLSPTLLEIAGAPLTDGTWNQGHSLLPRLLNGPGDSDHLAFSEAGTAVRFRWQKSVQDRRFKLILAPAGQASKWYPGKKVTLYDLQSDPDETRDASADHPDARERLSLELRKWLRSSKPKEGMEQRPEEEMDPETRRQLEALGYIG